MTELHFAAGSIFPQAFPLFNMVKSEMKSKRGKNSKRIPRSFK
jgi:hypothetical protein